MANKSRLLTFFLFLSTFVFTQNYNSCTTSLEICSKGILRVDYNRDTLKTDEFSGEDCMGGKYNPVWLT